MIKNTFLSTTLGDLLAQLGQSNETIVEVYYLFALGKPKPKHSSPQDEWIFVICPLNHFVNEKAKSYVVGLMNGDIKLYDNKHAELLKVSTVNDTITCGLYFKSDTLNCNILVTGSESPNAGLQFGQIGAERSNYTVVGNANTKIVEQSEGVSSLS